LKLDSLKQDFVFTSNDELTDIFEFALILSNTAALNVKFGLTSQGNALNVKFGLTSQGNALNVKFGLTSQGKS